MILSDTTTSATAPVQPPDIITPSRSQLRRLAVTDRGELGQPAAYLFARGDWSEILDPMGDHESPEDSGYSLYDSWGEKFPSVELYTGSDATAHRWLVYLAIADTSGCQPVAVNDLPSLLMLMPMVAPLGVVDYLADAAFDRREGN